MLKIDGQTPDRLLFDWRHFMFIAPIESDITLVTDIQSDDLFPRIYGERYLVPSPEGDNLPLILPSPDNWIDLPYWFPCSPTLWVHPSQAEAIYSTELLPPDETDPAFQGNQALAYPGLFHSLLIYDVIIFEINSIFVL